MPLCKCNNIAQYYTLRKTIQSSKPILNPKLGIQFLPTISLFHFKPFILDPETFFSQFFKTDSRIGEICCNIDVPRLRIAYNECDVET